jgi:hypothetical protein
LYPELRRTASAGEDLTRTARKASDSLVRLAANERLPTLQRMLRVKLNPHGLPVIDGARNSETWSRIIFIAGCIIIVTA